MKKIEAIKLFGGVKKLADAIQITHSAVSMWPDELSPTMRDRVIAAALRHGKPIPEHWLKREQAS
ncbi:hypothetical protein D6833_03735 [Candidatus Parcubacteria bacterium]|nr:MAG: hypothetical protein D6833_03735 [Candidatus Parcubacteria bacterium]